MRLYINQRITPFSDFIFLCYLKYLPEINLFINISSLLNAFINKIYLLDDVLYKI